MKTTAALLVAMMLPCVFALGVLTQEYRTNRDNLIRLKTPVCWRTGEVHQGSGTIQPFAKFPDCDEGFASRSPYTLKLMSFPTPNLSPQEQLEVGAFVRRNPDYTFVKWGRGSGDHRLFVQYAHCGNPTVSCVEPDDLIPTTQSSERVFKPTAIKESTVDENTHR